METCAHLDKWIFEVDGDRWCFACVEARRVIATLRAEQAEVEIERLWADNEDYRNKWERETLKAMNAEAERDELKARLERVREWMEDVSAYLECPNYEPLRRALAGEGE